MMQSPVSIEFSGVKEVRAFIQKSNKQALNAMPKALARASIFMQGKVKLSIAGKEAEPQSVDTGRFLNSVAISQIGKLEAAVFSKLSYAGFLEFVVGGKGRRHFENSKNRNAGKMREIFRKEFEKEFKQILGKVSKGFRLLKKI